MQEKLSSYEDNLIWMSMRYCIGRHTAASTMHAYDIVKYSYNKMSKYQKRLLSEDIRRELTEWLRTHCHSNITYVQDDFFLPIKTFIDSLDLKDHFRFAYIADLLFTWMNLSNLCNEWQHKTYINENGVKIEYFDSYIYSYSDNTFVEVKRPIKEFIENPYKDIII